VKLLYKPLGLAVGILGGVIARALFKQIWKVTTGEEEAPKPTDARRSWREVLIAAAVQGAIFAVVKAALDRATAQGTGQLTGDEADEPAAAGA
jgi:hypothetical protein